MTDLLLEHPREDAKLLIKAAFEETPRIKKYADNGMQIIGETGMGIMSYGANIIVDISEHPKDPNKTPISVRGEKKISINITSDHYKTKSNFIQILNGLREYDIDDIVDVMAERMGVDAGENSFDKTTSKTQSKGNLLDSLLKILAIIVILIILLSFMSYLAVLF